MMMTFMQPSHTIANRLLGGKVSAPTIDGEKNVDIAEGTQNNSKVVLKDQEECPTSIGAAQETRYST